MNVPLSLVKVTLCYAVRSTGRTKVIILMLLYHAAVVVLTLFIVVGTAIFNHTTYGWSNCSWSWYHLCKQFVWLIHAFSITAKISCSLYHTSLAIPTSEFFFRAQLIKVIFRKQFPLFVYFFVCTSYKTFIQKLKVSGLMRKLQTYNSNTVFNPSGFILLFS